MQRNARHWTTIVSALPLALCSCTTTVDEQTNVAPTRTRLVFTDHFAEPLALFDTVFWEPRDTTSLRQRIVTTDVVHEKEVLEIGTGSGLISLCCLKAGASRVVATDVNPAAVSNARYNARNLGIDTRFDVRQVPLGRTGAFSVIGEAEQFDLIISNPPWENRKPETIGQYGLYDEGFALLRSLLADLRLHLKPDGRAFLVYGCVKAIRQAETLAPEFGLKIRILDDRNIDALDPVFLPGMLLEVVARHGG